MQERISPTPGLKIPSPDAGAGQPLMGPSGGLCRLSRAQVCELEAAWRARMQYRPGVGQGFPASTGLGVVLFL